MQQPAIAKSTSKQVSIIEVSTAYLTGLALNYCIAMTEGHEVYVETVEDQVARIDPEVFTEEEICRLREIYKPKVRFDEFCPCHDYSEDWNHGGLLITKYRICFDDENGLFLAVLKDADGSSVFSYGFTHLIAAGRAIVTAKFGAKVSVPSVLVSLE